MSPAANWVLARSWKRPSNCRRRSPTRTRASAVCHSAQFSSQLLTKLRRVTWASAFDCITRLVAASARARRLPLMSNGMLRPKVLVRSVPSRSYTRSRDGLWSGWRAASSRALAAARRASEARRAGCCVQAELTAARSGSGARLDTVGPLCAMAARGNSNATAHARRAMSGRDIGKSSNERRTSRQRAMQLATSGRSDDGWALWLEGATGHS